MTIKFCTIKAHDGRYNYGADSPVTRALLALEPVGLFATSAEAAEALTAAIQAAYDAGAPKPKIITQRDIDEQIFEVRRFRHPMPAAVIVSHYTYGGQGIGFCYRKNPKVGQWIECKDGTRQRIVAVVNPESAP